MAPAGSRCPAHTSQILIYLWHKTPRLTTSNRSLAAWVLRPLVSSHSIHCYTQAVRGVIVVSLWCISQGILCTLLRIRCFKAHKLGWLCYCNVALVKLTSKAAGVTAKSLFQSSQTRRLMLLQSLSFKAHK
jgi:hypothetical protein